MLYRCRLNKAMFTRQALYIQTSMSILNSMRDSSGYNRLVSIRKRLVPTAGSRVVWMPDKTASLSGEVRGNTIYIYEVEEEKAIQALKHEVVDHLYNIKNTQTTSGPYQPTNQGKRSRNIQRKGENRRNSLKNYLASAFCLHIINKAVMNDKFLCWSYFANLR